MTQSIFPDISSFLGPSFFKQTIHLGAALDQTGQLSLYNSSSAFPTIFQAGNATAAATYTFPTALPAGNDYVLASSTAGVLSWFNAPGGYAPLSPSYVTLATDATLPNERVLTGTSNRIILTDNGAGSTIVLSTPQDIHTAATPTFAGETITASSSGGAVSLLLSNTSNTATSTSVLDVLVAGTSAGDAYVRLHLTGGQNWTIGMDNSDSQSFVIAESATLGSNNAMRIQVTGEINFPTQSSFLATGNGTSQTSVTGDGTAVTVNFGTTIYDQNADYNNSTMTFTAPVTGRYLFCFHTKLSNLLVTHTTIRFNLITSNRNYQHIYDESALSYSGVPGGITVIADMDAGDTALGQVNVSGGTKTIDIAGGATQTYFSGQLLA